MKMTEHITGFLFSEGRISFPGFGTLVLVRENAIRNHVKNKISGPKYNCVFYYDQYNEQNSAKFIEYLSRKNQIESDAIDNEFKKLSMDLLHQIAEKNNAILKGLGTFTKTDNGIAFSFSSGIKELLEISYPDYPLLVFKRSEMPEMPVLITEVEKTKKIEPSPFKPQKEVFHATKKSIPGKKRNRTGIIISAAATMAFLCFLICILNVFDTQKTYDDLAETRLDEVDTERFPPFTDEDDIFEFDESKEEKVFTDPDGTAKDRKTELSPHLYEITETADLNTLVDNSIELRNAFGNQTNIIICGSFRRYSNALGMLNKIREAKYQVFAEEYDGFIRIGIVSDMGIKSPDDMILEIRETIEENSWILLPPQD